MKTIKEEPPTLTALIAREKRNNILFLGIKTICPNDIFVSIAKFLYSEHLKQRIKLFENELKVLDNITFVWISGSASPDN